MTLLRNYGWLGLFWMAAMSTLVRNGAPMLDGVMLSVILLATAWGGWSLGRRSR